MGVQQKHALELFPPQPDFTDVWRCMQVRSYLFAQSDLNLTRSDEATPASNVIYLLELLPPPKAPALAFLDSGGAVPAPPRQVCV